MHPLVIVLSGLFLAILEFSVFFPEWYIFSLVALLMLLVSIRPLVFRGSSRGNVLLFFFGIFSWALLLFIDDMVRQHIFSVISGSLLFWMLWGYRRWHEGPLVGMTKSILSAITIASVFLFFSVLIGILINYSVPIWSFMGFMGFGAYILTHQYLSGIARDNVHVKMYSVAVGIFFVELGWMTQFWPFGYLTTGVILLILYYVLWDVLSSYTEGVFTRSRAWGDVTVLIVLVSMVLLTTPWTLTQ